MAEKYGTVPKRFTPEWWNYFWMYYKGHVFGAIFLIIVTIVTIIQIASSPKYDLEIVYSGKNLYPEAMVNDIEAVISPYSEDVDGNGKKSVFLQQININKQADIEFAASNMQKLNLTLSEDNVYIYILEEETVAPYLGESPEESSFVPLDDWLDYDKEETSVFSENGTAYGIELTECAVFREIEKDNDLNFSGKYMFIRYYPREDQLKTQLKGYNAAINLAKKLVKG